MAVKRKMSQKYFFKNFIFKGVERIFLYGNDADVN